MADSSVVNPAIAEDTSPDLLKNTPTNIARLEDVIEHSIGRHKYLAQTRSPSDGGDIRWYFCQVPLAEHELAASIPRTEIVGKGKYFRFGTRDSLAIEACFLQREEELLSSWWREYAECSVGPRTTSSTMLDKEKIAGSIESAAAQLNEVEEERVGVPVKGGLYEVDLVKRHCFPVYWSGENRRALRGHWFARKGGLDWLPLREDVAEQLETAYRSQVWHRRTFQQSGLFAARIDLQGSTLGLHALFTGEDDTWEAWLNVDAHSFSNVIGLGGIGIKLRRGYSASHSAKPSQDELHQQKEEQMDDYCSQITSSLAERHLTSHQRATQRVLFIPCQVSNQLNRLFLKFLKRNPGYDGKVSIYGHSLGSVLSYDILCHQENLCSPYPMDFIYKESDRNEESMNNQSTSCSSLINCEGCISKAVNESKERGDSVVEEKISVQSTVIYEGGHEAFSAVLTPCTTDFNERTVMSVDSEERSDKGVVHEKFSDTDDLHSGERDHLSEAARMKYENAVSVLGKKAVEDCKNASDRDQVIKFLEEEIDFLKAKIQKLESVCISEDASSGLHKENKEALLTSSRQPMSAEVPPKLDDVPKSYTPSIKYTKLEFKVDTFYAVGSPLGVFLALRNMRLGIGKGQHYWEEENISEEMPACHQMFNIFHPFDPVAYRIEPLVCKEYMGKHPVIIPYHKGGRRLHIGFQEFTEDIAARSQAVMDSLDSVRVRVLTMCQSKSTESLEDGEENTREKEERTYGSLMMERLTGSEAGRIDHMLQDKTFEHPYLQAIGSHTNYWRDNDTALFILKHLYKDIPEEANSTEESSQSNSGNVTGSGGWFDQRDTAEEELPLTFSNRMMVKNFSRKARRFMKNS
uniref:DDHD domain-containing protein n=1 Tax=Rhizophora mucronata TaxID=61149 RepID=A0A2P2MMR8_RHIMU